MKNLFDSFSRGENWYICANCCKTTQANHPPTESGCKVSGSTHNYWFSGKAGNWNYTCRNCDAEVYLTSSITPSASKCCANGSHDWYHR